MEERVRVFVGAPSDVNNEREIIKKVINNMNKFYRGTEYAKFDLIELEKDVRSNIGSGLEAQEVIDSKVTGNYDLFIGILWKKFGTPTKKYESGTQQEFENALESDAEIMFYFSKLPTSPHEIDPKQLEKILNFKESIQDDGLYYEYSSMEDFEELITNNLRILAIEKNKKINKTKENKNDKKNEEKSMIGLIESTLDNFKEVEKDAKDLLKLFDELNNNFNKINPPKENNLQSIKIFSNSVADLLNQLSHNFKIKEKTLITHYSNGINDLIESLELFGSYMDRNTRKTMEQGINSHINVLNDMNNQMYEIIDIYDEIPPMTNKLIKAKSKFIKNIKELLKDLKNLRSLLYKSLIELNDSNK